MKKEGIETTKGSIQDRITHREELQITLDEILDKFDEEDLEVGINNLKEAKDKLRDVESTIDKLQVKVDSLYERKEHLDSHKYNEDPFCKMDLYYYFFLNLQFHFLVLLKAAELQHNLFSSVPG